MKQGYHCNKCNIDFTNKNKEHFDHEDYSFVPPIKIDVTNQIIDFFIGKQNRRVGKQ